MEVLHGNQADSKYSRRRSDRHTLASNRLLDWAAHDADISLLPHSPLALAAVLTQKGGYLDLVALPVGDDAPNLPSERAEEQKPAEEKLVLKEKKREARQRFNLLTNHSEADLLKQCKKILVENALIKNKGDRQLYLAAGFIKWSSATQSNTLQRAPLLLYPALLVRIPREQRYEIRLTGDTPEFNDVLHQHLEQSHSCVLPTYREDMPLADFFAHVAESVNNTPAVELEFDIALGTAGLINNASTERRLSLPNIPAHFDTALAMSITSNKSLENLTSLLQLIPDFHSTNIEEGVVIDPNHPREMNGAGDLRRYAAKLSAEGLDHIEFRQLHSLPALIAQWNELMLSASSTPTLTQAMSISDLSARELIKLSGIIELIDKAPDKIEQWGHSDLCYASSTSLLLRAQHQAKLIEHELQALQEHFHLEKVPAKSQLLTLMGELGGGIDHEPDIIDADYFHARRQFMEFSTNKPANLTTEHRRSLSQLAKVFRFRELFVNNVEYRCALGPGYKGLRTDWPRLIKLSEFARELAQTLGSETIAESVISNWSQFRKSFAHDLDTLRQSAEATRHLLSVVGSRWQTQKMSALAAHASLIAGRLEEWQVEYDSAESHADKTAAMVLSSFSGPFMDQRLVETQADETQAYIRQQLANGDIRIEQISDTLSWLAQASAAASADDLDIEAIVEHLQSA